LEPTELTADGTAMSDERRGMNCVMGGGRNNDTALAAIAAIGIVALDASAAAALE